MPERAFGAEEMWPGGGFLEVEEAQRDPASARVMVIPAPFDGTSTWVKGADQGPRAIIEASQHLENYEPEDGWEPSERGIATHGGIDAGLGLEEVVERVEGVVGRALALGKIPIVLGGEHSVSIGAIRAAASSARGRLTVVQIDAHSDLRDSYHGSGLNHACVMARAREVAEIVQVGLRSVSREELGTMDPARTFWAHEIVDAPDEAWMRRVEALLAGDVYVTIDLDGFDPSIVPATGTPEPGGLGWGQVSRLLGRIAERARIVGGDVVELCPQPGQHASAQVGAKITQRLISCALRSQGFGP
ncbi:MAG: agmatinase [Phycisphaerales bacterium JB059]